MIRRVLILGAALLALSGLWGTAPLGRVLLAVGLPGLAEPLLADPEWKGIAAARAGNHARAAALFHDARAWLNLGNAEVAQGNYAAAMEAYDIGRAIGDPQASANFDILAAFYAGLAIQADTIVDMTEPDKADIIAESFIGRGDGRAAGQGDEATNASTGFMPPELLQHGALRDGVRKVFDEAYVVANDRWLATLEDTPGVFLAERLRAEQKRRAAE